MTITEKVAYIKGLAEGLDINDSTKEGKLLNAIVDALGDIADNVDGLEEYVSELTDQVDAIDEDLDTLETDFYDDEEDDDFDELDDEYFDVECPECNLEFTVDEETLLDGEVVCPSCGEKLEFEVECDDDCDCHSDCE